MKLFNVKEISFAMLLILILFVSISSIQAGDVNDTVLNSNDDIALSIEDNSQLEADDKESDLGVDSSQQDIKNQTELISPASNKIYYGGKYEVTLIDSGNGAPLAGKTVKFSIGDKAYSANTNSKGVASVQLKLSPGTYLATSYFAGDDSFNASNKLSGKIKILTTIKAKDVTKYYQQNKYYQATYLNSNGKVLKNKDVPVTVNGKKYTFKTKTDGVLKLSINLKPGTYKVVTSNPTTGEKLTTNFKVLTTIKASNLKKVRGDSRKFVVQFLKKNGKALAKQQVKIKINSTTQTYRTNTNGKVGITFNDYKAGKYKVVCRNNDGLSKAFTVQVLKVASTKVTTSSYTFLKSETKVINVKVATSLGGKSGAGLKVHIFIDDKMYTKKTDSNAEINFKLPSISAGVHHLDCIVQSTMFFKTSDVHKYLTILSTSNTKFTADGSMPYGSFSGTTFSVVLGAGNVPLMQKTVTFNVNGKTSTAKTDTSGLASVPINLDVGNYTVSYKFAGDSILKASSGATDISVVERMNTTVSCSYKTSYKDSSQTFDVYLKDSNGTPLKNHHVELIINGKSYKGNTDAKGHAAITTILPVGKYDFSVKFGGDNDYNFSSTSGSTTVTLSKYADGINEKNAKASSSYLKATRNCQVGNAKIKSLVNSLTKGLTSDLDKAKALFEYVQLNIKYDYYFDSEKGAVKTLESKEGNGADQAHLLIAMYRTAGLKARYVHGNCNFVLDGKTFGHVWTQVLIDDTWICGDTTEVVNRLGSISSWNVNKFTLWNKYLELPF